MSLAQSDPISPISVTIKLEKEDSDVLSKEYFSNASDRFEFSITTDSVKQEQYDIEVSIKNNSTRPVFIWLMTCSRMENFEINNDYIFENWHSCTRDFPELVKFDPKESRVYNITLRKSIKFDYPCRNCIHGPEVASTKLGLILIDDIYKPGLDFQKYLLAMEDKSLWKIVWSNPLFLLTKNEVSGGVN
jgi:hypothetical protein